MTRVWLQLVTIDVKTSIVTSSNRHSSDGDVPIIYPVTFAVPYKGEIRTFQCAA